MARKCFDKSAGGQSYRIYQLGGKEASRMGFVLSQVMARGMTGAAKNDMGAMAAALTLSEFENIRDTLAPITEVLYPDGRAVKLSDVFDDHFAGNPGGVVDWLILALEVNFSDFFATLVSRLSTLLAKKAPVAAASPSPPATSAS